MGMNRLVQGIGRRLPGPVYNNFQKAYSGQMQWHIWRAEMGVVVGRGSSPAQCKVNTKDNEKYAKVCLNTWGKWHIWK